MLTDLPWCSVTALTFIDLLVRIIHCLSILYLYLPGDLPAISVLPGFRYGGIRDCSAAGEEESRGSDLDWGSDF